VERRGVVAVVGDSRRTEEGAFTLETDVFTSKTFFVLFMVL